MIKFFRHIRQRLVNQNRFSKYLLYAIGEIVLVVIGILIALQINNWNTNRAIQKEELKILKGLAEEFGQNLANFDSIYTYHLRRKTSIERVMAPDIQALSTDSLALLQKYIGNNYTFNPYQGIHNAVINSGKIELISNDSLKQKISKFQDLLSDYQEEEMYTMGFVKDNMYPFILEHRTLHFNTFFGFSERTGEEQRNYRDDLLRMVASDTYENILVYTYGYMRDIFVEGPILRAEMVSIIKLLESEIGKHK
jgi:hypothetical protein